MRKFLLFLFLIFAIKGSFAAVFTVTSNANAGAGTLREAITLANGNGTATTDYINFNLPGNTISAMSIALETELPILSSNLIIDGTTQPFSAFGNPNIRISLVRVVTAYFNGLRLDHASAIEIYGLSFSNFKADPQGTIDEKKGGIYLYDSSNITIGAPNKPNCFGGNYAGILSPFGIPRFDVQNIRISANIFGFAENGINPVPNETGIDMSFLKNSTIGGILPEEGNLLANNTRGHITLGAADGLVTIENNSIGFDKNGQLKPGLTTNGIYVNGNGAQPSILKNRIGGMGKAIMLDYVNGGFQITCNRIGTGTLGTENYANDIGVHINFSLAGTIGGASLADQNYIANNKTAVLVEISYPVSILKNSIYCNTTAVTFKNLPAGKVITQSAIGSISPNEVRGMYLPNAWIELFYTDECIDCEGKTWLATIPTAADGSWVYNGPITGKITSMGTNADGATSTFSKPKIDDSGIQKTGTTCGQTTAGIRGLKIYDASVFRWYNLAGQLVGSGRDLENIPAGTYYLKAGQLGACDVTSAQYSISASDNGIGDGAKVITNTLCGATNGSIRNIQVTNNMPRVWYNISGQVVGTANDLENVAAGRYYFKTGTGGCEITSAIYTITNANKTFLVSTSEVIPARCGQSSGSIAIKTFQTDVPAQFRWLNEAGTTIGNSRNLNNLAPGTYTLFASDGSFCESKAGVFKVEEIAPPLIDLSQMQTYTSCDGKTVSAQGAKVSGTTAPFTFVWINDQGLTVFSGINIKGILAGRYRLLVRDQFNCEVQSEVVDFTALANQALIVPNSISPNGDGVNDTWKIKGVENYEAAEFYIFGRTGQQLFYSKGYTKEFDGTFNGALLPVGVYYYFIDLKNECGKLSGALTLIR